MNIQELIKYINEPENIDNNSVEKIEELLISYPYFQTGHLLFVKGLLNSESIRYNQQLKKTASYSYDRKQLFQLISSDINNIETEKESEEKQELEIGKPLNFDETENYSFSEWLSLSEIKKIERSKQKEENILINDFIQNPDSIKQVKKKNFFKPISAAKNSLLENDELVTPTLAKVYLEQEHFEKAILAYKKLCLKYPEKNSFFASQIKLIKKLKEK